MMTFRKPLANLDSLNGDTTMRQISETQEYNDPETIVLEQEGYSFLGINILTGEACRLGQRLLCDLNEDGVELVERYLGCKVKAESNQNSMVGEKPAVASVFLGRETLREMGVFGLMLKGAKACVLASEKTGFRNIGIFSEARLRQYTEYNERLIQQAKAAGLSEQDIYCTDKGQPYLESQFKLSKNPLIKPAIEPKPTRGQEMKM